MSLEFRVLIDAIKLPAALALPPPLTSTSAAFKYQVTWSAGNGKHPSEEGATLPLANTEGEVLFHHEAQFRTPKTPDRLLQLTVLQIRNGSEEQRAILGVLVIDLNAHTPKQGHVTSMQRATLGLSLCQYDPPAMIRLAIESTKSHVPYDPEADDRKVLDARRRSASRQRSLTQQTPRDERNTEHASQPRDGSQPNVSAKSAGMIVPPLPLSPSTFESSPARPALTVIPGEELLADDKMEIARLKAALHTLNNANKQLRDDNTLLRNAVQKAREEPDYTYQVQRSVGLSKSHHDPGVSPEPRPPRSEILVEDNISILQAEIAVLQRGLAAAKERLQQKEAVELDLRAEIRSLTMTNSFQAEDIQRLEDEVRAFNAKERNLANEEAELLAQKRVVLELQAKSRLLAVELQNEENLRGKLEEAHKHLQKEYDHVVRRRQQAEEEDRIRRESHQSLVTQLEHRLSKAQDELEVLHKYAADANERCHSIAHIVESQSKIIGTKNDKIRSLKALMEAQEVYQKMIERHGSNSVTNKAGQRAPSPSASIRPATPRQPTRH